MAMRGLYCSHCGVCRMQSIVRRVMIIQLRGEMLKRGLLQKAGYRIRLSEEIRCLTLGKQTS